MNLDVESLRTFLAVLDHGGMTRAAENLHLSQSAVSWKIKRLEDRVGRPLLIREGHSLRPSQDGRALLDDARSIVAIHDRAVERLRSTDLTGIVRFGSNEEIETARLALVLGRFKRTHPAATIEFTVGATETLVDLIDRGELDLGIIQVSDAGLRPSDVILWTDDLVWATCCETPYLNGVVPLITFGDTCFYRPLSEPILAKHQIDYSIAFSGQSSTGVQSAVAAGLGVAVLGSRCLGGNIVEWELSKSFEPLPSVHQITRISGGEQSEISNALVSAISTELHEPPVGSTIGGSRQAI